VLVVVPLLEDHTLRSQQIAKAGTEMSLYVSLIITRLGLLNAPSLTGSPDGVG